MVENPYSGTSSKEIESILHPPDSSWTQFISWTYQGLTKLLRWTSVDSDSLSVSLDIYQRERDMYIYVAEAFRTYSTNRSYNRI